MKAFIISLCVIGALCCAVFVTDCATGEPRWEPGIVTDKIYQPERVHFHSSTDKNGRTTTSTTTDGPDYYVIARVADRAGRISVAQWTYDQYQVGQECYVQFRTGRIMEYGFTSIAPKRPVEP